MWNTVQESPSRMYFPGGEGIDFEAPNLQLQIQPAQLLEADCTCS
jgi:hypothetical protein